MITVRRPGRQAGFSPRGFTLVELLTVLAMVSVLAVLAIVGYRRYMEYSKAGDAQAVLGAIRIAEENYRAETLSYLNCSPGALNTGWYPADPAGSGQKRHWINPSHPQYDCWRMLNVVTDSPTRYGFTVEAGAPDDPMPTPATASAPTWPTPPTEPWYVVQAKGDNDADNVTFGYFLASSLNGEVYSEMPDE